MLLLSQAFSCKYKQRCRKVKRSLSPSFANSHRHDKQHTLAYLTSKYVPGLILKPPQTPKLSRIIYHFCKVLCVRGDCTCLYKPPPPHTHTSGWHLRSEAIILHGFNLNARMAAKKAQKKLYSTKSFLMSWWQCIKERHSLGFLKLEQLQLGNSISSDFNGKNLPFKAKVNSCMIPLFYQVKAEHQIKWQ